MDLGPQDQSQRRFWAADRSQRRENGREKPGDRLSGPGDHSGAISVHFRRFGTMRPICDLIEHGDIATIETSETSILCVETRQMSALATEDICPVSTADICPVSAADICPVSTADICPVSTEDIYPVSTEDRAAAGSCSVFS